MPSKRLLAEISGESFRALLQVNNLLEFIGSEEDVKQYAISVLDIEAFTLILEYANSFLCVHSIDYLCPLHFSREVTEEEKVFLVKLFLMLMWSSRFFYAEFRISTTDFLSIVNKATKKMFLEGILHQEHLVLILKAKAVYSSLDRDMLYGFDKSFIQRSKTIRNIEVIRAIIDFLCSFKDEQLPQRKFEDLNGVVNQFIVFFLSVFLEDSNNIHILSDDSRMLRLLEVIHSDYASNTTKELIVQSLLKIYSFRLHLEWLYEEIDKLFMAKDITNCIRRITTQMRLIQRLIKAEEKAIKSSDGFLIKRGFCHNDHPDSGISSSFIAFPKDGYTAVVSFKLIPGQFHKDKSAYTVFSIHDQLIVYIKGDKLRIESRKKVNDLFDIKANLTYVLWIFHNGSNAMFYLNSLSQSIQLDNVSYPQGLIEVNLGQKMLIEREGGTVSSIQYADPFTGEIGTFILFNQHLLKDVKTLLSLREEYEALVFIDYNQQFNTLEALLKRTVAYFQGNNDIKQRIELIISSRSLCPFSKDKSASTGRYLVYKANYFNALPDVNGNRPTFQMKNSIRQYSYDQGSYAFSKRQCLVEMIRKSGIMYLELHLAYLISHCKEIEHQQATECLISIIDVFMLAVKYVEDCNIYHQDSGLSVMIRRDMFNFLMSFEQLIGMLFNKGDRLSLNFLCSFFNDFEYLLKTKLFFEHCELFLRYDYYEEKALLCLFALIAKFIDYYPKDFCTEKFYHRLLKFTKVYVTDDCKEQRKSLTELLRKYLSFCLEHHSEHSRIIQLFIQTVTSIPLINKDQRDEDSDDNEVNPNQTRMKKKNSSFSPSITLQLLELLYSSIQSKAAYNNLLIILQSYRNEGNDDADESIPLKEKLSSFLKDCFEFVNTLQSNADIIRKQIKKMEIIKALCIRLLDDLYYRCFTEASFAYKVSSNFAPIGERVTVSSRLTVRKSRSPNKARFIASNEDSKELDTLMPFIKSLSPSEYTLRSLYLMLFSISKSNQIKLKFILKGKETQLIPLLSNKIKEPLNELLYLFERLTASDRKTSPSLLFCLYNLLFEFFKLFFVKYYSSPEKDKQINSKSAIDIAEINKACSLMYISLFTSDLLSIVKLNDQNEMLLKAESDLFELIKLTFSSSPSPFYFELFLKLYVTYNKEDLALKGIKHITSLFTKEAASVITEVNQKNLIVLIYTIVCYEPKREFLFNSTTFIKDFIIYLSTFLNSSELVLTKFTFPIERLRNSRIDRKDKEKAKVGFKMLIEMVFEIYFECLRDKAKFKAAKSELFEFLILEMLIKSYVGTNREQSKKTLCYFIDKADIRPQEQQSLNSIEPLRTYLSGVGIEEYKGSVTVLFLLKILIHLQVVEESTSEEILKINLAVIADQLFIDAIKLLKDKNAAKLLLQQGVKEAGLYSAMIIFIQNAAHMESYSFPKEQLYEIIKRFPEEKAQFMRVSSGVLFKKQKKEAFDTNYQCIHLITESSIIFSRMPQNISRNSFNGQSKGLLPKSKSNFTKPNPKSFINSNTAFYTRQTHYGPPLEAFTSFNSNEGRQFINAPLPLISRRYSFKKNFLKQAFSVYFNELLSNDPLFNELTHIFWDTYQSDIPDVKAHSMRYPTKVKNKISRNYSKVFLERDYKFWDRPTLKYSHPYLFNKTKHNSDARLLDSTALAHHLTLPKLSNGFEEQLKDESAKAIEHFCELITLSGVFFGRICLCENCLCFISDPAEPDPRLNKNSFDFALSSLEVDWIKDRKKNVIIYYEDIDEIINRRFLYKWIAIEFFLKDGRSYLFNLFSTKPHSQLFEWLKDCSLSPIENCKEHFQDMHFTEKWSTHELSTYDYLLQLNKYSSRSYNESSQYPIFPWLIRANKESRDFAYPMSLQSKAKRAEFHQRELFDGAPREHGNHYSTSAFACFYLMRVIPFTTNMLHLQGCKFDSPNRQFVKLEEILEICEIFKDNRELIPELLSSPDFFSNCNCNDFGVQDIDDSSNVVVGQRRVHNVIFSPFADTAIEFTYKMRGMLNNDPALNGQINEWLNYTFGVNQYAKDAMKVYTRFSSFAYAQEVNFDEMIEEGLNAIHSTKMILDDIYNKIGCILNLGQCPYVLFNESHPKRRVPPSAKLTAPRSMQSLPEAIALKPIQSVKKSGKRTHSTVTEAKQRQCFVYFGFSFNKNYLCFLTDQKELEVYYSKSFEKKMKMSPGYFKYLSKVDKEIHLFKPKYVFCELTELSFVFGRFLDNSLKVFLNSTTVNSLNSKVEVQLESFVTALVRVSEKEFLTGHETGEMFHWSIEANPIFTMRLIKKVQANLSGITALLYDYNINIAISSDSNSVIIRNFYDFEYLTLIKPQAKCSKRRLVIVDIKLSPYDLLYVMCCVREENSPSYVIMGYSLNGFFFGLIEGLFSGFAFASNGNLLCGYWRERVIRVFHCVTFALLHEKSLKEQAEDSNDSLYDFAYDSSCMLLYYCCTCKDGSSLRRVKLDLLSNEAQYFC